MTMPAEAGRRLSLASSTRVPDVSIIIPHFNMPEALLRCLASVRAQDFDGLAEIIVVDNGSHVSLDAVRAAHPEVVFLSETTPGPGPARNTGVAAARADILAFIDADCRAGAGWLAAAVAGVRAGGALAVVGGDVRIDVLDPARLTALEAYESVFAYRQRMYIEKMNFSGTGNLAMTRAAQARVGGFAGIGVAEDRDWGQRATAAGLCIRYIEPMRAYHPARTSFAELVQKWQRHVRHDHAALPPRAMARLKWQALRLAMLASIPVDSLRLLVSPRLAGLANRLRGIVILARIRWFRMVEMGRVARGGNADAGAIWQNSQ
jgi:glycosyltransferase involved in cell wall biosynthesis